MPPLFFTSTDKEMPYEEADDESVTLDDYRKKETEQIMQSPKPIVVVGSCSQTGKTTQFYRWRDAGAADWAFGMNDLNVDRGKRNWYADTIVVDEATDLDERAFCTIRQYRKLYRKIIVATGGTGFTPTEQAAFLRKRTIPPEIPGNDIDTVLWLIKLLNRQQIVSILKNEFERFTCSKPQDMPTERQFEAMTGAFVPELRIPLVVAQTARCIYDSVLNRQYYNQVLGWCGGGMGSIRCRNDLIMKQAVQFAKYMAGRTA